MAAPGVVSLTELDGCAGQFRYRLSWRPGEDDLLAGLVAADLQVEGAVAREGTWRFRVRAAGYDALAAFRDACEGRPDPVVVSRIRFPDHGALSRFHRLCAERDVSVSLRRVYDPGMPEDLGLEFALTDAQRLRRGIETVVTATLVREDPPGKDDRTKE